MKTQMRLLCFAVVILLAKAQIPTPLPAQILDNFRFPLDNYRPLLGLVQIETVFAENVDLSTVSVKSLTFPAQETSCSQLNTSMQGQECPLKENGKLMYCSAKVSYITQDGDIQGFELNCDAAIKEAFLNRVRRSKSGQGAGRGGRGSGRGGRGSGRGSRRGHSGRGSSIAGNKRNGRTRTA
ncbi:unnamed protein product [Lota lota]